MILALAIGLVAVSESQAAPLPDLKIQKAVVATPTTARVLVQNIGMKASGACWLRMNVYNKMTGVFVGSGSVLVPALIPGQSTWVSLQTMPAVLLTPNRRLLFIVDSTNIVAESNENNNLLIVLN